jgi:cobalt/nickel transport system permease protein
MIAFHGREPDCYRRFDIAHIPDGVLSAPVLITGGVATAAALTVATRRLDFDRIPQAALLAAALFVASLVSVPVGPSAVHLMLNGLMGLVLGWASVPAIVVALVMQAVFFGFGGLVALGVNAFNIALPALVCAFALGPLLPRAGPRGVFALGVAAGVFGVGLTGGLVAATLTLSGEGFAPAAKVIVATYVPLMAIEGAVTGATVAFVRRVAPELLNAPRQEAA